jgi:hypothetical protein
MIDYSRLEKGLSGVEPRAKAQPDIDELTASTLENARLKKVIDVQKTEIKRLTRLLGIGLQLK